ncbi:MAG: hypothetical protein ACPHUL_00435 [Marinomonas gallaica]
MSEKKCTRCGETKSFDLFGKRSASRDGMMAACKACLSKYDKQRDKSEHRKAARLNYAKTEKGKERGREAKKRYIERNPVKRAAHIITGNAIRGGILIKMPCEVCGGKNVHAHHDDYHYPLSVRWLCPLHHKEWHDKNGEAPNAREVS